MSNQAQLEQSRLSLEKRNKRQAAVLSGLLFAAVLVLCFFLTAFTIQGPPPGEQFVAVGFADLGSTEEAGGVTESEAPSEVVQEAEEEEVAAAEPVPEAPEAAEEVATQEENYQDKVLGESQSVTRVNISHVAYFQATTD